MLIFEGCFVDFLMELKKDNGRLGLQMVASQKVIMLMEKKMQQKNGKT